MNTNNGIIVLPEPKSSPPYMGETYFAVVYMDCSDSFKIHKGIWKGSDFEYLALENSSIHLTQKNAEQWVIWLNLNSDPDLDDIRDLIPEPINLNLDEGEYERQ